VLGGAIVDDERRTILEMVAAGTISPEDADRLLEALERLHITTALSRDDWFPAPPEGPWAGACALVASRATSGSRRPS
jgi:hypothetical protein